MQMKYMAALAVAALTILPVAAQQREGRNVPGNGVIDTPGLYTLKSDLFSSTTDRPAILITSNNVTLDMNGYAVNGPGGKVGVGVRVQSASGVAVMNGTISKMAFGVIVNSSANVVLKNLLIRAEGLPVTSLPPETGIMIAQSRNVVVEDNAIYSTGLGIFVRGSQSGGNRIANNTITANTNGVLGICYNPADTDPMGPRGDLVYGNVVSGFSIGIQFKAVAMANVAKENTIFYGSGVAIDNLNDTNIDMNNVKVKLP